MHETTLFDASPAPDVHLFRATRSLHHWRLEVTSHDVEPPGWRTEVYDALSVTEMADVLLAVLYGS